MFKVSILTACHNNGRFVNNCAESILQQDYDNLEWIVVDDNSSDDSVDCLEAIQDPRLIFLKNSSQKHCSSSYARALAEASGGICAIVDVDDAIVPGAVKKLVQLYRKYKHIGYIYTQHWWCDIKLNKKRKGLSSIPPANQSFTYSSIKTRTHSFSHWRTFRTNLRNQACLFPEGLRYSVDKNLGFVLERIAYGGFYPEPLYLYRYYKGNMSLVYANEQKITWMRLAKQFENEKSRVLGVTKLK
jgi:glycosyltransferase involved in cell wall biosynthesis